MEWGTAPVIYTKQPIALSLRDLSRTWPPKSQEFVTMAAVSFAISHEPDP
jgi:hypothetical protein